MPSHFINAWLHLHACPVHNRNWSLSQHSEALQHHHAPPPHPAPRWDEEAEAGEEEGSDGGGGSPIPARPAAEGEREESIVAGPQAATMTEAERRDLAFNRMTVTRPSPERKGTLWSSTLILISSVFGSSVLAVPYALAQCGYALGAACLVACALLTQAGSWMLVECARRVALEIQGAAQQQQGKSLPLPLLPVRVTLTQIAARATPWLKDLPEILVILSCLGSAVAALVVIGGIAPTTFRDIATLAGDSRLVDDDPPLSDYIRSRGVWIAIIFLLVAPLTFLRSLTPLRFTGVFTAVAVAFFALSVILSYALPGLHACSLYEVKAPCTLNAAALVTAPPGVFARLLQACPIFFVSFSVNFQVLPIHNALRVPKPSTTIAAVGAALAFSAAAYLIAGLGAYFTFGERIKPNLLANYGNNALMDTARALMHVVVGVLYPLVLFTARASVMNLLGPERSTRPWACTCHPHKPSQAQEAASSSTTTTTTAAPVFFTTTLTLFAFTLACAFAFKDLSTILGVVGAVATVPISLTLPALYLAYFTRGKTTREDAVLHWVGWFGVVLGMAMTGLFLYGTFAAAAG